MLAAALLHAKLHGRLCPQYLQLLPPHDALPPCLMSWTPQEAQQLQLPFLVVSESCREVIIGDGGRLLVYLGIVSNQVHPHTVHIPHSPLLRRVAAAQQQLQRLSPQANGALAVPGERCICWLLLAVNVACAVLPHCVESLP